MTIELTREQEKIVRGLVQAGRYDSVEQFIDEAITKAYIETQQFIEWAKERHQSAEADIKAGQVVTVPDGKLGEVLDQYRNGMLTFD